MKDLQFFRSETFVISSFLFILFIGYLLCIPYAEFLRDEAQMIRSLQAMQMGVWPVLWQGWYWLPHGILAAYIYFPFYQAWPSIYTLFVVNAALNVGTCFFFIKIGKILGKPNAGIVASLLYFLSPTFTGFYSQTIWQITPALFLSTVSIYWTLKYLDSNRLSQGILATLFLASCTQCHLLCQILFVPFFLILRGRKGGHLTIFLSIAFLTNVFQLLFIFGAAKALFYKIAFLSALAAALIIALWPRFESKRLLRLDLGFIALLIIVPFLVNFGSASHIWHIFGEMFNSIGSYNIAKNISSTNVGWIKALYPNLEWIAWICFVLIGFPRYTSCDSKEKAIWLLCLMPVSILVAIRAFGFGPSLAYVSHNHWIYCFPIHFLAIGIVCTDYRIFKRYLLPILCLGGIFAQTMLWAGISHDGRCTFNRPLLTERITSLSRIFALDSCPVIDLLVSQGNAELPFSLSTWPAIVDELNLHRNSLCNNEGRHYYLRVRNTIGESVESLNLVKQLGAEKVIEMGRIEVYLLRNGPDLGARIYPVPNRCAGSFDKKYGLTIVNMNC